MHDTPAASVWEAIVVGGSAAGLSAALMLGRSRRRTLVIDSGSPRNRFASHMHGVLGHEGVPPRELVEKGRKEVAAYGVQLLDATVTQVTEIPDGLRVTLDDGSEHTCRALIAASGIRDELPEIPGLAERWGAGVFHCPYCHGWEVADQRIGVLPTSPNSVHLAQLLRQLSDRVTLFPAGIGGLDAETETLLRARDVQIVDAAVTELGGENTITVRTADGESVEVDAIFTAGTPKPHDGYLADLGLERQELPGLGSFLSVDQMGRSSHERIWAIGNLVNPMANVPLAIGAGAFTGGAVNGALAGEDFAIALREDADREPTAVEFWEARYADADRIWSGRVNQVLADVAAGLSPGRALDLGAGEGGDAVWLAQQGWTVTGVDLSATAVERGRAAAAHAGIPPERLRFEAADLGEWSTDERFDLVTCSYLHSWPVQIPRERILRRAADFVAPGGRLLITAHAAPPPWADHVELHDHGFPTPEAELQALDLDPNHWRILAAELRERATTGPDGAPASLTDSVVIAQRID